MHTHNATTPAATQPILKRCASCGTLLHEPDGESMVRESAATRAMSTVQECAACRLAEYRRMVREQLSVWRDDDHRA